MVSLRSLDAQINGRKVDPRVNTMEIDSCYLDYPGNKEILTAGLLLDFNLEQP